MSHTPLHLGIVDRLAPRRWVPIVLREDGHRPLPHRFATAEAAREAACAAAAADPASTGYAVARAAPAETAGADELLRLGTQEGAGFGESADTWAAVLAGPGWWALVVTRDRLAGEAALALPPGSAAIALAGSGAWSIRSLAERRLIARGFE